MNSTEEENDIVCMASSVADKIDYSLSPCDGLVAIGQVYQDLPVAYAQRPTRRRWPWQRNSLRVRTARMDWAGIGLDFVEHGGHLHVIDVWHFSADRSLPKTDCVLAPPTDMDRYVRVVGPDDGDAD